MHPGIREPEALRAQAMPRNSRIPELGDGDTVQKCADNAPGAVSSEDGNHGPGDDAHAPRWEDAEVLHEDSGFGEENSGVVEGDCDPEGLALVSFPLRLAVFGALVVDTFICFSRMLGGMTAPCIPIPFRASTM